MNPTSNNATKHTQALVERGESRMTETMGAIDRDRGIDRCQVVLNRTETTVTGAGKGTG